MKEYLEIIGIITLCFPYLWEVLNDKDGDDHTSRADWNIKYKISSKTLDVYARGFFMLVASALNICITGHNFYASLFMSGAIFFLLFDYTIVYVLKKRKVIAADSKWYNYLGSKGIDNFEWWKNKSWQIRMAIKIAIFIIACVIYFN